MRLAAPVVAEALPTYTRPHDPKQSTEFTYLRFLLPLLAARSTEGGIYFKWALFLDDDMLFTDDVASLVADAWSNSGPDCAVYTVQHPETLKPKADTKLANVPQTQYPRKNWSSVMLFNLYHPVMSVLTPEFVSTASPADLHRLLWLTDETKQLGRLSGRWNWLVDWYTKEEQGSGSLIHYTDGGPWYPDHRADGMDYAEEWIAALRLYEESLTEQRILGPYERFSARDPPSPKWPDYPNSDEPYWSPDQEDEWQAYVRSTLIVDELAFAKTHSTLPVIDVYVP
jgi:hypothetical protein